MGVGVGEGVVVGVSLGMGTAVSLIGVIVGVGVPGGMVAMLMVGVGSAVDVQAVTNNPTSERTRIHFRVFIVNLLGKFSVKGPPSG
jgi:hypothetical protein